MITLILSDTDIIWKWGYLRQTKPKHVANYII